jgi:hypothetical protein
LRKYGGMQDVPRSKAHIGIVSEIGFLGALPKLAANLVALILGLPLASQDLAQS